MTARKILFLVTKLDLSGGQLVPIQLARALRARGHEVETWFLYVDRWAFQDEPGVKVILPRKARSPLDYLAILWKTIREVRRFKPDAVQTALPIGNVFGSLAAWLAGCRARVASQHYPADTQGRIMQLLDKIAGTLGFYTSNVIVSHAAYKSYADYPAAYVKRSLVIQNGLPVRRPTKTPEDVRKAYGLPAGKFLLGTAGRLDPQKNHMFLFKLMDRLPDIHFVIAGSGSLEDEYRTYLKENGLDDRVHLIGQIPENEVPNLLGAIDLFVLPSAYEGLPLILIEAMQAGAPVMASDIPMCREVVDRADGETAAFVAGLDEPDKWVEEILRVKEDPAERERLAQLGAEHIEAFDIDRMVDRYEQLLLEPEKPLATSEASASA